MGGPGILFSVLLSSVQCDSVVVVVVALLNGLKCFCSLSMLLQIPDTKVDRPETKGTVPGEQIVSEPIHRVVASQKQ